MTLAATIGGVTISDNVLFVIAGLGVLVATYVVARIVSSVAGDQLRRRHVRGDMVILGRRVATALVILLGVLAALGFAIENANVPLFGLLVATLVAALGVQDVLKDYVSGYYVLLERHFRVGDRIGYDNHQGTVSEIRLRVTLLTTDGGDIVVVPNSELFTKAVTIHGRKVADPPTTEPPK